MTTSNSPGRGVEIQLVLPAHMEKQIDYPQLQYLMHQEFEGLRLLDVKFEPDYYRAQLARLEFALYGNDEPVDGKKRVVKVLQESLTESYGDLDRSKFADEFQLCLQNYSQVAGDYHEVLARCQELETMLKKARRKLSSFPFTLVNDRYSSTCKLRRPVVAICLDDLNYQL